MGVEELWEPGHNLSHSQGLKVWREEEVTKPEPKMPIGQWNLISVDFVAGEDIYTPKAKHWRPLSFKCLNREACQMLKYLL